MPFLMGIVWAGIYPSNDPHVVAPLVVGAFVLICFALWESLSKTRFPLTPTHVFTSSWGRDFTAPAIALGVINMFYYSSSILWPNMTTQFYTDGGKRWKYAVVLSLPQGLAIAFGAFLLSTLGGKIRNWQWQLTGSVVIMVLFGSLLGLVTPYNKGTMIAFLFLSQMGFGYGLYLAIAITQMGVQQKNLGVSGGISGCIRFAAGASISPFFFPYMFLYRQDANRTVATSIYQTVYSNTLTSSTTEYVPQAAINAGMAESRATELMQAVSAGAAEMSKSFSPAVVSAATDALNQAYCRAILYSLPFLSLDG